MPVVDHHIPSLLERRAAEHPDAPAYTYIDFEVDPAGYVETLSWAQLQRRVRALAVELARHAAPGDRVAICAPQGLEYIVGLLGTLAGGFVAVPLSPPMFGTHDERVIGALHDSAPVMILSTSDVVDEVAECAREVTDAPSEVIEVDALDLDTPVDFDPDAATRTGTALLQYTSGSTRRPAGVQVSHKNIIVNLGQMISDHYGHSGGLPPADTTVITWLPFYHDLGLQFGIFYPIVADVRAVAMSPIAFLQKPARWMQLMASHPNSFTGAPNFAYELAVRRTSDADMSGLTLAGVLNFASGAERVQPATLRRFIDRFAPLGLPGQALRPGYGLAEATVYLSSSDTADAPRVVRFDYEKLAAGFAERCEGETGSELVSNGVPRACEVCIVDPETSMENPAGKVGEIWARGDNVCAGYWRNPKQTEQVFGARLANPASDTAAGPWLRTGDLGVISEGELFIVGRIKDLLIIDGRNHYPDDIEATISEISRGRVVAIAIATGTGEELVVIAEVKTGGASDEDTHTRLQTLKRQLAAAVSRSHGVRIADLVLVAPGSIPITTSGKIRRSASADVYRKGSLTRLDRTA